MTKRPSEGELGAALRNVDGLKVHVLRLPDPKSGEGVSNWKPADFIVWVSYVRWNGEPDTDATTTHWVEAKDTDAVARFPYSDIRPSQLAGIRDAERMGIPYWLAIYWRRSREWTISDAIRVLAWQRDQISGEETSVKSIPKTLLESRFGISTSKAQLSSTLKGVLSGEVD